MIFQEVEMKQLFILFGRSVVRKSSQESSWQPDKYPSKYYKGRTDGLSSELTPNMESNRMQIWKVYM